MGERARKSSREHRRAAQCSSVRSGSRQSSRVLGRTFIVKNDDEDALAEVMSNEELCVAGSFLSAAQCGGYETPDGPLNLSDRIEMASSDWQPTLIVHRQTKPRIGAPERQWFAELHGTGPHGVMGLSTAVLVDRDIDRGAVGVARVTIVVDDDGRFITQVLALVVRIGHDVRAAELGGYVGVSDTGEPIGAFDEAVGHMEFHLPQIARNLTAVLSGRIPSMPVEEFCAAADEGGEAS